MVTIACFIMAFCPYTTSPDWACLLPLIIVGFGYSIYASALWSSIPYIVPARTIGSAFGLATSIQNVGLVIAPFIVGLLEGRNPGKYVTTYIFLGSLSLLGMCFNIWLYYDDINNRNGTLHNVPSSVNDLMQSPPKPKRALVDAEEALLNLSPQHEEDDLPTATGLEVY